MSNNVQVEDPTEAIKHICHKLKTGDIYSKFVEYMSELDFEAEEKATEVYKVVRAFTTDANALKAFQWQGEVKHSWMASLVALNKFIANGGIIYITNSN